MNCMRSKKEKPNKETLEAIREVEEMEKNHSFGKIYHSVEELMKDLNSNEDLAN